jgi:hypothetical protein
LRRRSLCLLDNVGIGISEADVLSNRIANVA